mgnify:CR=1 FL=1
MTRNYDLAAIAQAIDAYTARIATLNGVSNTARHFAVDPKVQQTLETKMQESSAFLGRINIVGVTAQEGEAVGIGVGGTIAGRTNTNNADRVTRDVHTTEADAYKCVQTNYDTHLRYDKLDAWAHMPDFQTRVAASILQRQALDRIMTGWHGTSVAADTNRTTNPLLQDVNKGWIKKLRDGRPANVMSEVAAASGKIEVGPAVTAANGYKNLDALVLDMRGALDPWYHNDTSIVAICGTALLDDKYFTIVNGANVATEMVASDILMSTRRLGGLQAVTVPHFPANAVMVTPLNNLSIYYQRNGRRRMLIDSPKRHRLENYESSNDAYVIEDFGAAVHAENIELK